MKALILLAACVFAAPKTVVQPSPSELVAVKVMVKAGSAQDPAGREGLAQLTARLLIEGGFGDAKAPVTKEALAEITRPWGSGARPSVFVEKEATVFSMSVPAAKLDEFVEKVFAPMFAAPLFAEAELTRLKNESLQSLRSALRLENIELVGLTAMDNIVHEGTSYAHPSLGTERGIEAVSRADAASFYRAHYKPENMTLGLGTADARVKERLSAALERAGKIKAGKLKARAYQAPAKRAGRRAWILSLPNAISTGLHLGFPIEVTRNHPDYWPLFAANVWFGTHRDGFSHLYQEIRDKRGYNYGDYSYIEHFEGRPHNLFMPPNTPRRGQYFSIWIRPVQHEFAPHLLKAAVWELESFVRKGLSEEQCAGAKKKAKVLYLSLAETSDRLLAGKLDDEFYGLAPGHLDSYLSKIESATCAQMNAAIRKHLQWKDLDMLVVTDDESVETMRAALLSPEPAWGKEPSAYQIDAAEKNGKKVYDVPADKLDLLRKDAVWAHTPLELSPESVRVLPVSKLFETAALAY